MKAIEALQVLSYIHKPHKSDIKFIQGITAWCKSGKPTTRKQDWRIQAAYRRSQQSDYVQKEVIKR